MTGTFSFWVLKKFSPTNRTVGMFSFKCNEPLKIFLVGYKKMCQKLSESKLFNRNHVNFQLVCLLFAFKRNREIFISSISYGNERKNFSKFAHSERNLLSQTFLSFLHKERYHHNT